MSTQTIPQRVHPYKFIMWVTIAAICMMFAGLTSAYLVRKSQNNFQQFSLPSIFWWSTLVIVISSLTIQMALKYFKAREMKNYRYLLLVTAVLGVLFAGLQVVGFFNLEAHGIKLTGLNSNPAASFILVIVGVHAVHVLGGVVALLAITLQAYFGRTKTYSSTTLEVASTYWHFVDILWIYLLIFLMFMR
jgi:cytochrome c oxidase subunit III